MAEKSIEMSFDQLWRETEVARKDPFLVQIVRSATSPEAAAKETERFDYPTHLSRQARLLGQIKDHHRDAWVSQIEHPQIALGFPYAHEYPCEWEVQCSWGVDKINSGTLVVTKTEHEAPVVWGYKLIDEFGEEVCRSHDLGRDMFWRDDLLQMAHVVSVNCYLNSGSRLLPRNGLTISFSFQGYHLDFRRVINDMYTIWWNRVYQMGGVHLFRHISTGRQTAVHEIYLRPISPNTDDQQFDFEIGGTKDPYGLFLETSFLKRVKDKDEERGYRFGITTVYCVPGWVVEELAQRPSSGIYTGQKIRSLIRGGNGEYSTSSPGVVVHTLFPEDFKHYAGTYQVEERALEEILLCIERVTPPSIDIVATIKNMSNLLRTSNNIYYDGLRSLLVPA